MRLCERALVLLDFIGCQRAGGDQRVDGGNLLFAVFLFGGLWTGRNFFKYVFDKTFHYTREGWDKFTWNFAWFFVATAVANELVRQGFAHAHYEFSGYKLDGINIWILFKLFIVMPLSGLFAWWQTSLMQKYRLPAPVASSNARSQ